MGDGTQENPYTREDVLKLIEENGGKAQGLNLSGKKFVKGINLSGLDLRGINLEGADLTHAIFQGVFLSGVHLNDESHLDYIVWGNYKIGEEDKKNKTGEEYNKNLLDAQITYRQIKHHFANTGAYGTAGKFFYREMEVQRKYRSLNKEHFLELWSWIMRLSCGYGERPQNPLIWSAILIFLFTLIYFGCNQVWEWFALWRSLYFSAISFTAVGYGGWINGNWINIKSDWILGLGVTETIIGIFMMALFLVTITRKMAR